MPIIDVEENIKKIRRNIEQFTQEIFRLQGMLQTFEGFKKGGLKTIDLPNDPYQKPREPREPREPPEPQEPPEPPEHREPPEPREPPEHKGKQTYQQTEIPIDNSVGLLDVIAKHMTSEVKESPIND